MKVFYTPAIDGTYRPLLQRRMNDRTDNEVYAIVQQYTGEVGIEELSDRGYTKIIDRDPTGEVRGYWTYQQDDL
jgi:hypothetical protein